MGISARLEEGRMYQCPIRYALDLLSGKWMLPIFCRLSGGGAVRFGELKRSLAGVTNTMLAASLSEMQNDGLVERVQYNEMPLRVEYSLTPAGRNLSPILQSLGQWAVEAMDAEQEVIAAPVQGVLLADAG